MDTPNNATLRPPIQPIQPIQPIGATSPSSRSLSDKPASRILGELDNLYANIEDLQHCINKLEERLSVVSTPKPAGNESNKIAGEKVASEVEQKISTATDSIMRLKNTVIYITDNLDI